MMLKHAPDPLPVDAGLIEIAGDDARRRGMREGEVALGLLHPDFGVGEVFQVPGVIQMRMAQDHMADVFEGGADLR